MLDDTRKTCLPCGLHQPVRNHYFDGKFMTARDFRREQDYHRGHRHMHNALLHGTGTVCGLKLVEHPAPGCQRDYVVLEPGMAINCCGQEIVVPERTVVPVRELVESDPDLADALDGEKLLFVGLRARDCGTEKVPLILPGCEGESGAEEYGAMAESYDFVLWAQTASEAAPVEVPFNPTLKWVHSIVLPDAIPRAVHVNEGRSWLQVAVDALPDGSGSRLHVYEDETHDLVTTLDGPAQSSDTGSNRISDLVFVAGQDHAIDGGPLTGVAIWRAEDVAGDTAPVAVIPIENRHARIAVSPVSGTLYVLDYSNAAGKLVGYSVDAIRSWLTPGPAAGTAPTPISELDFGHGFGTVGESARRGAAMLTISPDESRIAVLGPTGQADQRFYLFRASAFAEGLTADDARATNYMPEGNPRLVAASWTIDGEFIYLLSRRQGGGNARMLIHRYAITGVGNTVEKKGRGVELPGTPLDLALAPTEKRAYVLLTPEMDGGGAAGVTQLITVDTEDIKSQAATDPLELEGAEDPVVIDGTGRAIALNLRGNRAYVSVQDAATDARPERGLVAVIEITEDDCSIHLDRQIEGCATCADDAHTVVLGHLVNYAAEVAPRMRDAGSGGPDDAVIDNFTYRPIVASTETLKKIVLCILEQGVAEGPPGPRGDPGTDGADGDDGDDGLGINDVVVTLLPPGSPPDASVTPNGDGLRLTLDLPQAADGDSAPAINDVQIIEIAAGQPPSGEVVPNAGGLRLILRLPRADGGGLPETNPIVAMSWRHGELYEPQAGSEMIPELLERGIAIAFEQPVLWKQVVPGGEAGPTNVATLQKRVAVAPGFEVWADFADLHAHPIRDVSITGTLLEDWTPLDGADLSEGLMLRLIEPVDLGIDRGEFFRFVFHADFVIDEAGRPVDGSHLAGELPTGKGAPGDTFRSWFAVER